MSHDALIADSLQPIVESEKERNRAVPAEHAYASS